MSERVLIDASPLVAIFSRRDRHHAICVDEFTRLEPPLYTCWPVLTEVAWLLRDRPRAVQRLFAAFESGLLSLLALDEDALEPIAQLLTRYRSLGAQLADAALVHLAHRERINTVFTLDRRDFTVYRGAGNRAFRLLPAI